MAKKYSYQWYGKEVRAKKENKRVRKDIAKTIKEVNHA